MSWLWYILLFVDLVLKALKKTGLHPSDPRLKHCMDKFRQASRESVGEVMMDRELFHRYNGGGDGRKSFVKKRISAATGCDLTLCCWSCSWDLGNISTLLHCSCTDNSSKESNHLLTLKKKVIEFVTHYNYYYYRQGHNWKTSYFFILFGLA